MADSKISDLTAVVTPAGTDELAVNQGGTSKKITVTQINSLASGGAGISGTPANNQLAVWVDATDIEGDSGLTWDGTTLGITGTINSADISCEDILIENAAATGVSFAAASTPILANVAATSVVPSLVPNKADTNSGIGLQTFDALSLIAGGVEMVRLTEATNDQMLIGPFGVAAAPSISWITDPDTGFFRSNTNRIGVALGGTEQWIFDGTSLDAGNTNGPSLENTAASGTSPTLVPNKGDTNTGIGRVSTDTLSLIAGGIEGIRIAEGASVITCTFGNSTTATHVFTGDVAVNQAAGPIMLDEDASSTNPTLVPDRADPDTGIGRNGVNELAMIGGGVQLGRFETTATLAAAETSFWLYDNDNASIEQVTVGAADSGGTGFKVLRIPN